MAGKKFIFSLIIAIGCSNILSPVNTDSETIGSHVRRKRYVVFPEGSSFSIALCLTVHTLTPDNIFTEGINWGISYDLPNESKPELDPFLQVRKDHVKLNKFSKKADGKKKNYYSSSHRDKIGKEKKYFYPHDYDDEQHHHYRQRRYRRNLYNKLEVVIDAMGFDGRECILRALCEASQRLMPRGKTLIEEMIRVVFALPMDKLFPFEPEDHLTYAQAHRAGHESRDCSAMFPVCAFSLIDMALGKYNGDSPASLDDLNDVMLNARLARLTMK